MKVTVIYQILLASLLLVGCTKVDLCDETTHPHVVDGFSVCLLYTSDAADD